ncbi:DNA replication and repair protein RecF [bacterium BMS3Abin02]|nr:DNA replication and repair protein RecF [bacterium BMS3Abin02]GBE22034.1 DNA replication and repair protein RecF [bacterium BMS3Bbin01]HDH26466.1 DNA replication and repair protein RecF [Actinomycetota bacterium]HDL48671.1 DNA replication and repair protein RecF [Actinomycetota bacterium]
MKLDWIELTDFRSYQRQRLVPAEDINVFVGPNGSGKTNLLEAVGYLAGLQSMRGVPDIVLVRRGADEAILRGEVTRANGASRIEVAIGRKRRVLVNGRRPARNSELLGHLRVATFLPDDLDIIKRGPAYRRDFLDTAAVQLWPGTYGDRRDYEQALRQRNALLKAGHVDRFTLAVWDERLSEAGARVMARRAAAARLLLERVEGIYRRLSGAKRKVELEYVSAWGATIDDVSIEHLRDRLKETLEAEREVDIERRQTSVGPHRDEPRFLLGGLSARMAASQGEQRTLVLGLKLASHAAVAEIVGEMPVLLLDDVFSELDAQRAAALADALPAAQTFITTARAEDVPLVGKRWDVSPGRVQ